VFVRYPSRSTLNLHATRRFAGVPVDDTVCLRTCWDYVLFKLFGIGWDANGYKAVVMSALWCRDLRTVPAVRDLHEQSKCLQDVPLTVRREFLEKLKWAEFDSE
jgi:hypothetical protein